MLCSFTASVAVNAQPSPIAGRWDVTIYEPAGAYPSWFEVNEKNGVFSGRYVGQFGTVRPIDEITVNDDFFNITLKPQHEDRKSNLVLKGRYFDDDILRGTYLNSVGGLAYFVASRTPAAPVQAPVTWGDPVILLAGNLDGNWKLRNGLPLSGWTLSNNVLANQISAADLVSVRTFSDFKLHIEYTVGKNSDSGVYLRGRYRVQLKDSYTIPCGILENAAIYGFAAPSVQTIKPAGQWNELDITLAGRFVTVVLNGISVIDNYELPGITGGALDSKEATPGPIMFKVDHGQVKFRNVVVYPAK
jgi:hypothetical protein